MRSIRLKITIITIAAILGTVLVVFLATFSMAQTQSDLTSVETMNLIGRDTGHVLEKYTEGIEQAVDMMANVATGSLDSVELVKGGVTGSDDWRTSRTKEQASKLDSYLADYRKGIEKTSTSIATHTQGVIAYYYCINPEVSKTEHGFFYSNVGKAGFVERVPLDASTFDSQDSGQTAWYYTTIERGRPSWIGPFKAHFLDDMWISSYLVPIYKSGSLIGVMGMDIPIDVFIEQVKSIRIYDTGFACLLDADGRIIYHPEREAGSKLNASIDETVFQQRESGNQIIRYMVNGQERQMAFTELSNGMKLVIVAPTAEINAASRQLIRIILIITAIITIIMAILMLVVMRRITNPLHQLTEASQQLAAGNYDVELNYKRKDEVGALTTAFRRMRDQLKEYIDDLNQRVRTDSLTGLSNQRFFFEYAEAEKERLGEEGKQLVALFFNLIGMKHFNQRFGFARGDILICQVADVLAREFGKENTSRFAQDHFAVIADDDRLEERLRNVFKECKQLNDGKSVPIAAGIYEGSLDPVDASTAFDRAKQACDQRRGSYVSGFCYFDEQMLKQADLVRHVIDHLDQALEENWVKVYYQPIVRAVNGKVCDEEALSRWVDPTRGFLSPADFIPALENSGLIYKLDLYMLEQVIQKMKMFEERGMTVVPQSINLSRSDFDSCDIVEEIRKRVDAAGISRDKITIELTESIIGRDFDFIKAQVERFQQLGFPVWMDDFGSGYSSLDVLQSIRFDLIKFDMSFMRKLDENDNAKIILRELMRMANSLGVDTVCEGVETQAQRHFLQDIGCSKLQGYFYCKPVSITELLERYEQGVQIGFENPAESNYYDALSKMNLYDLSVVSRESESPVQNAFNTVPMGIVEILGDRMRYVRTNQSYRVFARRFHRASDADGTSHVRLSPLDLGTSFVQALKDCCANDDRGLDDIKMPDGSIVHFILRRIQTNPVTNATAIAIVVLSVEEEGEGATYASIARALALDYYNIYYVDLDTGHFIEYRSPVGEENLVKERHGDHFFEETMEATKERMYAKDREPFLQYFTRENIIRDLDERGVFTATYRLVDTGTPMYVNMKVTRLEPNSNRVIMGISIVNATTDA